MANPEGIKALVAKYETRFANWNKQAERGDSWAAGHARQAADIVADLKALESLTAVAGDAEVVAEPAAWMFSYSDPGITQFSLYEPHVMPGDRPLPMKHPLYLHPTRQAVEGMVDLYLALSMRHLASEDDDGSDCETLWKAMTQDQRDEANRIVSAAINEAAAPQAGKGCDCRACRPQTVSDMRMIVCAICGNKRCPHANDHRNACTNSNESGQPGSAYPATPTNDASGEKK